MQPRQITDARGWLSEASNVQSVERKVRESFSSMFDLYPWFGLKVMKAKISLDTSIPTAATDGFNIFCNPMMVHLMSMAELIFTLCHEVMHIALEHHTRRGDRDPVLWNMAGDYVINAVLILFGLKAPQGILHDTRFINMSIDEVYRILEIEQEEEEEEEEEGRGRRGGGHGNGPRSKQKHKDEEIEDEESATKEDGDDAEEGGTGGGGSGTDDANNEDGRGHGNGPCSKYEDEEGATSNEEDGDDADSDDTEEGGTDDADNEDGIGDDGNYKLPDPAQWGQVIDAANADGSALTDEDKAEEHERQIAENAASERFAKQVGDMPTALSNALDANLVRSKHDWRKELRRFIERAMGRNVEHAWSRPNRRSVYRGIYNPGVVKDGYGEVVIAGDASGSVYTHEFELGLAQVGQIINKLKPKKTHWIQFDDKVLSATEYRMGSKFDNPTRDGCGGTIFRPVLEYLKENRIKPTVIIVLTDMGLCDWGDFEKPRCPIVWCNVSYKIKHDDMPWLPFGKVIDIKR